MKNYSEYLAEQYDRLQDLRVKKHQAILNDDTLLSYSYYKQIKFILNIVV